MNQEIIVEGPWSDKPQKLAKQLESMGVSYRCSGNRPDGTSVFTILSVPDGVEFPPKPSSVQP